MENTILETTLLSILNTEEIALEKACISALTLLSKGRLVAIPTETVYGLAANAFCSDAILRLYETKGRPRFNPLILHLSDLKQAQKYVYFSPLAQKLAEAFWPGALTLVLPRKEKNLVSDLASAGLDTIAVRVPNHFFTQKLLKRSPWPLVAPSANLSGKISPTSAVHVLESLKGKVDLILDGGECQIGVESTIVAVPDNQSAYLLRPGGLTRNEIEAVIKTPLLKANLEETPDAPVSPGRLKSHYAPNTPMVLNFLPDQINSIVQKNEAPAFLTFGASHPFSAQIPASHQINLSSQGCLKEAATNFFWALRQLDSLHPDTIYVSPVPDKGLGEALNDRLQRAATPKSE